MANLTLLSIQVGLPRSHGTEGAKGPMDRPWTTGFYKEPVAGPVPLNRTNLAGDGQADLENHGGPDQAVHAYSADHYPAWRAELGRPEMTFGAFGENFSVAGQTEADVCLGDRWAIGDVLLEVSQPRLPCWKLARRWRVKDLALRVDRTGRSGWYLRVIKEGQVAAGQVCELVERPFPAWTVARANKLWLHDKNNSVDAAKLAKLPCLGTTWKLMLAFRLKKLEGFDDDCRLVGPNAS